jgi:hypothetical protein
MLKKAWVYSERVTCTEEKRNVIRVWSESFEGSRQRLRSKRKEK